jgi:hypothetical protein
VSPAPTISTRTPSGHWLPEAQRFGGCDRVADVTRRISVRSQAKVTAPCVKGHAGTGGGDPAHESCRTPRNAHPGHGRLPRCIQRETRRMTRLIAGHSTLGSGRWVAIGRTFVPINSGGSQIRTLRGPRRVRPRCAIRWWDNPPWLSQSQRPSTTLRSHARSRIRPVRSLQTLWLAQW